jgi:hypothetical protein
VARFWGLELYETMKRQFVKTMEQASSQFMVNELKGGIGIENIRKVVDQQTEGREISVIFML